MTSSPTTVDPERDGIPQTLRAGEPFKSAVISQCGTYRYELVRRWSDAPLVGWVMLNPSTADAEVDDPTIRRCINFAASWAYGGIVVRNLFALRATDPGELDQHPDPVGPENNEYLAHCRHEVMTVIAWGARGGHRGHTVLDLLTRHGVRPYQLAQTKSAQPRHPLYLPANLRPTPVAGDVLTGVAA